jgi:hypothetical protein
MRLFTRTAHSTVYTDCRAKEVYNLLLWLRTSQNTSLQRVRSHYTSMDNLKNGFAHCAHELLLPYALLLTSFQLIRFQRILRQSFPALKLVIVTFGNHQYYPSTYITSRPFLFGAGKYHFLPLATILTLLPLSSNS